MLSRLLNSSLNRSSKTLLNSNIKSLPSLINNFSTFHENSQIGFIGLGNMGGFMAANLLKANKKVAVLDVNQEAIDKAVSQGATTVSTPAEIGEISDIIITMLPAGQHVREVLLGENGVFKTKKDHAIIVDGSTIDLATSKEIHGIAQGKMIDAPVSGGVTGAEAGTLTFMVGGTNETLDIAKEHVLQHMGKNIIHCGDPGAGLITKFCNNLALAISMIGTSEAINLGVRLGMDPKVLSDVMNISTSRCWSSDTYNPCPGVMDGVPSSRDYEGGFGSALMLKDLNLALEAAAQSKSTHPLGAQAQQLYSMLCNHGKGKKDFSVVYDWLQKDL